MFATLPQSTIDFWKKFPLMESHHEYMEKLQNIHSSWANFLQSNMEYNKLSQVFWENFVKDFPDYMKKNYENLNFQEFDTSKKNGLKFFEECWEKTIEGYNTTSNDVIDNLGTFRDQLFDFFSPILNNPNLTSQTNKASK
ncbi:hypothetical protein [Candidatus Uabimicrobium sp. HlEnr_7]|uniref:hypothetical protein n=1 Tax=Candidatus Uabimicrobium helgolandensis TaxID=3095367 RepID=UPI003555E3AF